MTDTDTRIGADVIYQINKRETTGPGEQEYEAPHRGIVTSIEVGPHVTAITVHSKRHDGTEYDETLIEGTDVIEWPEERSPQDNVSPSEPNALAAWLLAKPLRTILRDRHGDAWQRGEGEEYEAGRGHLARVFPALLGIHHFGPCELAAGCSDVRALAENYGPFTVLALGAGVTS